MSLRRNLTLSVLEINQLNVKLTLLSQLTNLIGSDGVVPSTAIDFTSGTITLIDTKTVIANVVSPAKRFQFDASGISTGVIRSWKVQDSSDTFVGRATTDTLTNKTLRAVDGTAAAPSIAFGNSTGSGLFKAGTNILGISTAGVQAVWVNATQQVGIGVTPTHALSIAGDGIAQITSTSSAFGNFAAGADTNAGNGLYQGGSGRVDVYFGRSFANLGVLMTTGTTSAGLAIGTFTAKILTIGTNNTAAITVSTSQQVGINIAPAAVLHVNGSLRIDGQASTGANTPTLGTNKPGSALTLTPQKWLAVNLDGTSYFIPCWT